MRLCSTLNNRHHFNRQEQRFLWKVMCSCCENLSEGGVYRGICYSSDAFSKMSSL